MEPFENQRRVFRELHESGCFVIPNPWNPGTARYLEHLGFRALASTSGGFAFSQALPDGDWAVPLDLVLEHLREMVAATSLPINADFESGFAPEPEGVAESVKRCVQTGVAGLSIEDATGNTRDPLFELPLALERIRASRKAIDDTGSAVLLTARAECYLVGHADPFRESVRRLQAYAEAGADVLFAPGVIEPKEIRAIVAAVAPRPVNILMSSNTGMSVDQLAGMGVRRISVGSSLARAAWTGFINAAREIAEKGTFGSFENSIAYGELNSFFRGLRRNASTT